MYGSKHLVFKAKETKNLMRSTLIYSGELNIFKRSALRVSLSSLDNKEKTLLCLVPGPVKLSTVRKHMAGEGHLNCQQGNQKLCPLVPFQGLPQCSEFPTRPHRSKVELQPTGTTLGTKPLTH